MKVLLLIWGDIHLKGKTKLPYFEDFKNLMRQKFNKGYYKLFLVIPGDIAFSGNQEEYVIATKYIDELLDVMNELGDTEILFVPGNHDVYFDNRVNREEMNDKLLNILGLESKNLDIEQEFNDYNNKRLRAFMDFANNYNLNFENEKVISKIYKLKEYSLGFTLINTAYFSVFKDENNDNDRGIHYIDQASLKSIKKLADIDITLMHHSPEWFHESIRRKFIDKIKLNSEVLIYGHEHTSSDEQNDNILSIRNGAFSPHGEVKPAFKIGLMDLQQESIDLINYSWDDVRNIFTIEKEPTKLIKSYYNRILKMKYKDDVLNSFPLDPECWDSNEDYIKSGFVFPVLEIQHDFNDDEEKENTIKHISSMNDFTDILVEYDLIKITGKPYSGKTSLLCKLFKKLMNGYIVLYHDALQYGGKMKANRIVRHILDNQFENGNLDHLYNTFFDENNQNKILLIDNISAINDQERVVKELSAYFSKIIFTSDQKESIDLTKIITDNEYLKNEITLKILPFLKEKREELIKTIIKSKSKWRITDVNNLQIKKITKYIDSQIRIFQLSPRFITVYVKEYLSGNASKYNNNFSTVFLNNIYNTISDALVKDGTKKEIKMDVLIALYSKIAFESYIDKSYPISYLKITKTVNEFFEAKGLVGFSKNQYTRALFSSNIFMESSSNNSYVFSSTSYLAYFIARHIYGFFFKSKGREMVNDLIDNIDIRINDDIILFLTFLLGDQGDEILLEVIDNANNFMADWEELDLDEINIRFLKNVKESIKLPQPNEQDVVEKNRIQNEIENETLEDRELNHVNVFEREHEKKSVIDSIKAYKSIEFISKVMPDLLINLDEKDKIKVINAYYSYPNKMLYNLFSQIDNNFDKVLLNLKKMINEHENSDENIDKKMESLITYISQIIIASVYSFETDIGITDENLLLILKHSKDSATHNLMNIFAYAKLEMTKELLDKALKLKKSENAIINQVLSFAVASLFIDSPKLMYKSDSTTSKLRQYFLEHDPKKVKAIKDRKSI